MDKLWNKSHTTFDVTRKWPGGIKNKLEYYKWAVQFCGRQKLKTMTSTELQACEIVRKSIKYTGVKDASIMEYCSEYAFLELGAHTWYVDALTAQTMLTAKVDEDLTGLFIPYDVMDFVFEKGFKIGKFPLRSVRMCLIRSEITRRIIERICEFHDDEPLIRFYVDVGESATTGECSENCPDEEIVKWHWYRGVSDAKIPNQKNTLNNEELEVMKAACKIACACLLLYSFRPEQIAPFSLPRSQRFQIADAERRKNFKIIELPKYKIIRPASQTQGIGNEKSGHIRGWVFRVLKNERFARKKDGSFATSVIPPILIKGGPDLEE